MNPLELGLTLLGLHALADYPLQGALMLRAKNRREPVRGVPWWQALGAHGAIHGLFVGLATGLWWLGVAETVAHCAIDDLKCRGELTFTQDQMLHVVCKAAWVLLYALVTLGALHI